mmetsp:Transcript_38085/g.42939  ORF Transcript_38085/g.42939 Transcript_38085/m.42939 type:complete len:586 (+) Transcript_38085:109-1866(+)
MTRSSIMSRSSLLLFLLLQTTTVQVVNADLNYYLYINEVDNSVVLESLGTLPFHKSKSTQDTGESCPALVHEEGGINPHYLCLGPHSVGGIDFFPIAPTEDYVTADGTHDTLPFKFAKFEQSYGIFSALLLFRNAFAIDSAIARHHTILTGGDRAIKGTAFGIDHSNQEFNHDWLGDGNAGDLIYEWTLLNKEQGHGGTPLRDGKIRLIKGKPPTLSSQLGFVAATTISGGAATIDSESIAGDSDNTANTLEDLSSLPWLPSSSSSSSYEDDSITATICSDAQNHELSTFCGLLIQVGLDEMLSTCDTGATNYGDSSVQYTIYAPTNEAFSKTYKNHNTNYDDTILVPLTLPQLLSGHDLTKLLLNHIVEGPQAVRYEDMICGTKTVMSNGQITKTGCNAEGKVDYVFGRGNDSEHKPTFTHKNDDGKLHCNGIIHTVEYVILPSHDHQQEEEEYTHFTVANFNGNQQLDTSEEEDKKDVAGSSPTRLIDALRPVSTKGQVVTVNKGFDINSNTGEEQDHAVVVNEGGGKVIITPRVDIDIDDQNQPVHSTTTSTSMQQQHEQQNENENDNNNNRKRKQLRHRRF